MYSTASVIAYEDTQPVVSELAQYLEYHEFAALWFHPSEPLVLVAYGAASETWSFLYTGQPLPLGPKIRILVRNRMPGPNPVMVQQPPDVQPQPQIIMNEAPTQVDQVTYDLPDKVKDMYTKSSDVHAIDPVQSSMVHGYGADPHSGPITSVTTNPSPAIEAHKEVPLMIGEVLESKRFRQGPESPRPENSTQALNSHNLHSRDDDSDSSSAHVDHFPMQFDLGTTDPSSIDAVFKGQFKITYDRLTLLNMAPTSRKVTLDPGKARFYLSFPSNHTSAMEALRSLLSRRTISNLICTSQDRSGWDAFRTILGEKGDHIGVIMVCMSMKSSTIIR